mmetsp:Transcript_11051/g.28337  ORF Transcript_11051/g.28337 Transcript_11051/m.28337 type:complete len:118 (-) Transcript_11051:10-363(-)
MPRDSLTHGRTTPGTPRPLRQLTCGQAWRPLSRALILWLLRDASCASLHARPACVTRTAAFPLEQIASVASGAEAAGRGTGTPLVLPLRQHRKSSATLFTPTPALAEDLRSGHLPPL